MSKPQDKQTEARLGRERLINGGLIGIGLILTQAFISLGTYDVPATICIFAFAIAIPLLASNVMIRYLIAERKVPITKASVFLYGVGRIAYVIGITAAFWHVPWIAGTLLLGSGAIGFTIYYYYVLSFV